MKRFAPHLLAALLAACVYEAPVDEASRADLPPLAMERAEPRLALAEHVLEEYFTSDIVAPPTICLAVSEGGAEGGALGALPPEQETALIARFPRLAPFSRCAWREGGWRDTKTDAPALVFTLHGFTCESAEQCRGWAGYTAGATSSPSALYRMTYRSGRWNFERDLRLIME